jgi:hypothetical protein
MDNILDNSSQDTDKTLMVDKQGTDGRFQKGHAGSKPIGTKHRRTKFLEGLKEIGLTEPELIHKVLERAIDGDAVCLRIVQENLWPKFRPQLPALELAGSPDNDWKEHSGQILDLMASGTIPPDLADAAMGVIQKRANLIELDDLRQRIEQLEGNRT